MGLFQSKNNKKDGKDGATEAEQIFYDEYFREELRNHSRWYFEKIINENAALFKQDLDATITQVHTELKDHLTKQLDAQFAEYGKEMKAAQDEALVTLDHSIKDLKTQHEQLGAKLEKSIEYQEAMLTNVFDKNKARMESMAQAQDAAIEALNTSVQALQKQQQDLGEALESSVNAQKEFLVASFQENMAQVIEHYLLGALGDQYDLKAQLPAIIKQMEDNKQTIVDDVKL